MLKETQQVVEDVEVVLQVLLGEGVAMCDGYHVGWFYPDHPRPITVTFDRLGDKLMVSRARGKLYVEDCPSELANVR